MTDRTYSIAVAESEATNRPVANRLRALLSPPAPSNLWFQKHMEEVKASANLFQQVAAARHRSAKGG